MIISVLLAVHALTPQVPEPVQAARAWRSSHEREILSEFRDVLAIPNVSRDPAGLKRTAEWITEALGKRGVATRKLEVRFAPPVVYGEIATPGAERTIVFYAHYDGQPVDPRQWTTPPFAPTLRDASLEDGGRVVPWPIAEGVAIDPEWRLYARSAGDDKAPVVALLTALDALRAAGIALRANVKFFFEGEEERGSLHLKQILTKYREVVAGDLWVFCDGPVHQSRTQQVVFGVRGVTGFELTVYGARRQLHSGHYGNWAPNPAMMLAQLLASMKDADGTVLIDGFYDEVEPLSPVEEAALAAAPKLDDALKRELWLARTEGRGERLDRLINAPSLNVRGLASAGVGPLGRNVVPTTATASIDIRLVKGMDPRRTVDRVVEHIKRQGYHVTDVEPDAEARLAHARIARVVRRGGYAAMRTPMDSDLAQRVLRAVRSARGDVIVTPTLGGSLPLAVFEQVLGVPVVIVPIANHDNNQHAPDENLRLQNLWDGIETMAALLTME